MLLNRINCLQFVGVAKDSAEDAYFMVDAALPEGGTSDGNHDGETPRQARLFIPKGSRVALCSEAVHYNRAFFSVSMSGGFLIFRR